MLCTRFVIITVVKNFIKDFFNEAALFYTNAYLA